MSTSNPSPRLRIGLFPSLPFYFFAIMAFTIVGAFVVQTLEAESSAFSFPLLIPFLVLLVRDFLKQPETEIQRHRLVRASPDQHPELQAHIARLTTKAGVLQSPYIYFTPLPQKLFVFGTFRLRCLAISWDLANRLESDLQAGGPNQRRAEAVLLHELHHLSLRDILIVGFARSLLWVGFWFCAVNLFVWTGVAILTFAFPAASLFTPEFWAKVVAVRPEYAVLGDFWPTTPPAGATDPPNLSLILFLFTSTFSPLMITIGAMYFLIWPRLNAVRELYADNGVLEKQKDAKPLLNALGFYRNLGTLPSLAQSRWHPWLEQARAKLYDRWNNYLFPLYPSDERRKASLANPALVFASAAGDGWRAGLLITLLDVFLINPFIFFYAVAIPGVMPVVIGILTASFAQLPKFFQPAAPHQTHQPRLRAMLGPLLSVRMGYHLLNIIALAVAAVVAPDWLGGILTGWTHALARSTIFTGIEFDPSMLPQLMLDALMAWVYLLGLIAVSVWGANALETALRRRVLTWYALPGGGHALRRWFLWILLGVLVLVAGVWLPMLSAIVPIFPLNALPFSGWALIGFLLMACMGGGLVFARLHQRYGGRCPQCQEQVAGDFWLGRGCEHCGQVLWPDLII